MKNFLFGDKNFYYKLFTLAIPVVMQNLITSSLAMVDNVMVGALGNEAVAAVGVANQFGLLVFLLYAAIHSGAGIFIAQFWGKKDTESINKVVNVGIALSSAVMLPFTLAGIILPKQIISIFNTDPIVIKQGAEFLSILSLSFICASISFGISVGLRSIGRSVMPMVISGTALGINTILNWILIFGLFGMPAMGVRGAATATLISRIVEMTIFMVVSWKYYDILKIKISVLSTVTKDLFRRIVSNTIPVVLNEVCWGLGFVIYSVAYGRISTEAFDAVQITNNITNLFLVAGFGMASASAVMIGHVIGAGEEHKGREYAWKFVFICIASGVVLGTILYFTSPFIITLFKVTPDVVKAATIILGLNSVILPIRLTNIVSVVGILRGGGDAGFAFKAEGITMWLIGVPLAFIGAFVLRLEIQWVVLMVMAEEIVKVTVAILRLKSDKWIKNVVLEEVA